jgi:hypothetical protein
MKKLGKPFIVYLCLSAFTWLFNAVYGLFAHGVKSPYMANMYLVMLGGALFYLLLQQIPNLRHRRFYRLFVNTLNTAVAFTVVGMMLRGIIDIAGSSSNYIVWYFNIAGIGFALALLLFMLTLLIPRKTIKAK